MITGADMADEPPQLAAALDAVARSKQAALVFGFLEDYLVGRQRVLDKALFIALENGTPTTHLLSQKLEAHLFVRNLEALIKQGVASARLVQPYMERFEDAAPPG